MHTQVPNHDMQSVVAIVKHCIVCSCHNYKRPCPTAVGTVVMVPLCMQYALIRAQRTSSLNTEDSWMYEDGHDEIVFSVDQPCQLLGVGLCGTEGAYTAELELLEVQHPCMMCLRFTCVCAGRFWQL